MRYKRKKHTDEPTKIRESSCVNGHLETPELASRFPIARRKDADLGSEKTVAEFFAGIGLMRMGLEKAGWRVVFANDIALEKRAMYTGHFVDASDHFHLGDIHKLTADEIPAVTLATASFPCNDLSLAGARAGLNGKQSSAFWGCASIPQGVGKLTGGSGACLEIQ
jgi:hypothetical protein